MQFQNKLVVIKTSNSKTEFQDDVDLSYESDENKDELEEITSNQIDLS